MKVTWASMTDVGRVREHNEDSVVPEPGTGVVSRRLVAAVADGMGGHAAGEIASRAAIEAATSMRGSPVRRVQAANLAVIEAAALQPRLAGMGTTLTLAMITTDGAVDLGHVGDSRAYRFSDGVLEKITTDHSYVAEMIEAGQLTPKEAEDHPYRSVVTRAIGLDPAVVVDSHELKLSSGDRFLLCSDGLTSMVDDSSIRSILESSALSEDAATALIDAANLAGGADNISVVVVDFA
jgi:protein phosphatase